MAKFNKQERARKYADTSRECIRRAFVIAHHAGLSLQQMQHEIEQALKITDGKIQEIESAKERLVHELDEAGTALAAERVDLREKLTAVGALRAQVVDAQRTVEDTAAKLGTTPEELAKAAASPSDEILEHKDVTEAMAAVDAVAAEAMPGIEVMGEMLGSVPEKPTVEDILRREG